MTSLSIALIHNNQADRLAHVRPAIKELAIALGERFHVDVFEICWQPDVKSHGLFNAFMRDGLYRHLAREWAVYRKIGVSPFARDWVSFLKYAFGKYLLRESERLVWQRNSAIEMIVTAKHARAWDAARASPPPDARVRGSRAAACSSPPRWDRARTRTARAPP